MKKRFLSLLLVLVMVLGMFPTGAMAAGDVTGVSDQAGLAAMKDGNYKLTQDITLENWTTKEDFKGTLDGDGYTITLTGSTLFGTLKGTVSNLILDGRVTQTASRNTGALCQNASGATIRNCISDVTVTYSGSSSWTYVGQLSGTFNSGAKISNCLLLGSVDPGVTSLYGAVGAGFAAPTISNCVAVGYSAIAMKEGYPSNSIITGTGCTLFDSADSFVPADFVDSFNANRTAGDLEWEVKNGGLTLKRMAVDPATPEEIAALTTAIGAAEAVDNNKLYTATTWSAFNDALTAARAINVGASPTQSVVVTATSNLTSAKDALTERNIGAVVLPTADVISVTQANVSVLSEQLSAGKYFRLDGDITINGTFWSGAFETMNSVLDGNGHTITLGNNKPLFGTIGPDGIVQNLGIRGRAQNSTNDTGAIARDSSGLIVNCWSSAAVTSAGPNNMIKNTGGFVANLKSGGAIINSYMAGSVTAGGNTGEGKVGALAGTAEGNTLVQNCYWQNSVSDTAIGSGSGLTSDNAAKTEREIKTAEFVELLNQNKGEYGKTWTQSDSGYPHLGAASNYQPPEPLEITFTNYKGEKIVFSSDDGLTIPLSTQDTTTNRGYAGELSAEGVTSWNNLSFDSTGQNNVILTYDLDSDGCAEIYLNKTGTATIQANDTNNTRVTITITDAPKVHAMRLKVGEQLYTDGSSMTVQGSEYVSFTAEVQYEEDGTWDALPAGLLKFNAANGTGSAHLTENTFHATAPGTMSVTATYEGLDTSGETARIDTKSVTVNITSEYVPITSITPDANGEYVIHGRNANSSGSSEFLDLKLGHATGSVTVLPENASYKDNWKLESSDPDVAEYVDAFLKAVLPKKAGTVTLTATATGPDETATGSTTITLKYANPVTAVALSSDSNAFEVKTDEKIALPIIFTGADNSYTYVTEPGMIWSYESSDGGEVKIVRNGNEGIITGSSDPKEYCVGNPEYQIKGIKAGTVTVTGTPVDTTNTVDPVTFTVTVRGEAAAVDVDKLVADGISGAQRYITKNALDELGYGFEWTIFSMMRSGGTIPQSSIDAYLDSVASTYKASPAADSEEMNPTTLARVAIALGALGENAADFRGLSFTQWLYSSDKIAAPAGTSNDAMYALIALDTQKYSVPTNAKWTRELLINEILTYQNANGGFGLSNNATVSVDMTAMALQALAPYCNNANVKSAVDKAVGWLKSQINADGIFAGTADSTAQVLTALSALNIDPADTESGFTGLITGLLSFQNANGSFNYSGKANLMTTNQSLYALEAYRRYLSGEKDLYDMTHVAVDPHAVLESRLAEANSLIEGDYTAASWSSMVEARNAAQTVFDSQTATNEDLNAADTALKAAIAALVKESGSAGSSNTGESISAYVTIVNKGEVVVPQLIVSVTDQNNSGGYDVDDALYAAHKATYPGGAANGYGSNFGDYGLAISRLWGDTSSNYGYWLDNASCRSLADTIEAGDHVVAFVYQKPYPDSDSYSKFDKFDYTATAGTALTVSAEKAGYDGNGNTVFSTLTSAKIVAYDDNFDALPEGDYTVTNNRDGSYSVTFNKSGFYYLVISCSDPLIVPAVSTVTVSAAAGTPSVPEGGVPVVYIRVADPNGRTYLSKTAYEFKEGETAYSLLLRTGLDVKSRRSEYGIYVEAIEGLGEFDEGSGSGWMYRIDGEFPGYSSALYDLRAEEYVEWLYTRDLGEDVGGGGSGGTVKTKDYAAAREVKALINAIGTVTKDSGDAIKTARKAYDALTDVQKDLVPNYDDLVAAEKKYAGLTKNEMVFTDVAETDYFYEAVKWAVEKGITNGTSDTTFSPNASCTRAQMVTFLWRAAGEPKAKTTTCVFTDVDKDAYYYEALLWAVENGITNGTSDTTFSPNASCTRGQMATFLYRNAKTPAVTGDHPFTDVKDDAYYNDAVIWAAKEGITNGTSDTTFSPDADCTRGQMVTFLYRYLTE